MPPSTTVYPITLDALGTVPVTVAERGEGRPVLVLHGGSGPQSVAEFADLLAQTQHVRVLTPIHPGFAGTPRPDALGSVADLAALYHALLERLGLVDVTVIGNSVGGWIAAEMAVSASPRMARLILLDATGIEVPDHPVADVADKTLREILDLSYANPAPFLVDPTRLPPAARSLAAGNMAALATYTARRGGDPDLLARLSTLTLATAVLWGERDRIVDAEYGRAFADAIPGASFSLFARAGHAPQIESPEEVVAAVGDFLAASRAWRHDYTESTTAAPEQVWGALRRQYTGTTSNDTGDHIVLHGPFAVGTELSITPHGADFVVDCRITELVDGAIYAYRSHFNGLAITSRHLLTRLPNGTRITHQSEVAGPGADTSGPAIGARITADRADTMRELITAAMQR